MSAVIAQQCGFIINNECTQRSRRHSLHFDSAHKSKTTKHTKAKQNSVLFLSAIFMRLLVAVLVVIVALIKAFSVWVIGNINLICFDRRRSQHIKVETKRKHQTLSCTVLLSIICTHRHTLNYKNSLSMNSCLILFKIVSIGIENKYIVPIAYK